MLDGLNRRSVVSWALYDWANSAFATTVIAGFFPVFLTEFWSEEAEPTTVTFWLGAANSTAGLLVAVCSPILGAIADRGGIRKKLLALFTGLGVVLTGGLSLVAQGQWELAALLYVLATFGFSGSLTFYDALLAEVTTRRKADVVSGIGMAAGYLGGGLLFAVNVLMVRNPDWFGLADADTAVQVSFLSVAIWWALFSIPLFLFVPERRPPEAVPLGQAIRGGLVQLGRTLREIRRLRTVFLFLLGYWLYIDGVDTIVRMAVNYGISLEFPSSSVIVALLVTQFVGFPAALLFGKLGEKIGAKQGIFLGLSVYLVVTVWGSLMQDVWEFYALAILIGLVMGGVQALSRSLFLRIIPRSRAAQFFGFYNLIGKFSVMVGPLLMGAVGRVTGSPRLSILSVLVLFVAGGLLLTRVNEADGRAAADAFEAEGGDGS